MENFDETHEENPGAGQPLSHAALMANTTPLDELPPVPQNGNGGSALVSNDLLHNFGHSDGKSWNFVKPGNDPLELLMRTVFDDKEELLRVLALYSKLKKYNHQDGIEDLMAYMAGKCAIKGRSTLLMMFVETGVVAPGLLEALLGGPGRISKKDKELYMAPRRYDDNPNNGRPPYDHRDNRK